MNERGWFKTLVAKLGNDCIGFHIFEQFGSYVLCHAPWYDKDLFRDRSLPTYMWFKLIEGATADPGIRFVDLGNGPVSGFPKGHYKLRYNPQDLGYKVKMCLFCGYRRLFRDIHETFVCPNCGKSVDFWRRVAGFRP